MTSIDGLSPAHCRYCWRKMPFVRQMSIEPASSLQTVGCMKFEGLEPSRIWRSPNAGNEQNAGAGGSRAGDPGPWTWATCAFCG